MLFGVVLHAALPYMERTMSGTLWLMYEPSGWFFDALCWAIHTVRLPLFFLLSGFFAARQLASRGREGFLAHRTRRLLLPLVAGLLTILPLTYAVWAWGLIETGYLERSAALGLRLDGPTQQALVGPAHLWFLIDLFYLSLGYWALTRRRPTPPWSHLALASWAPLALAVPGALIMTLSPETYTGFRNTFQPDLPRLAYYAVFFTAGVCLSAHADKLQGVVGRAPWMLGAAVGLLVVQGVLLRNHREAEVLGTVTSLAAWTTAFAVFGFGAGALQRPRPTVRFLSDAAYWTYLIHLPLVGAFGMLLYRQPLPTWLKLLLVVSLTLGVCLFTYRAWVRPTRLGLFLHGPRPTKG